MNYNDWIEAYTKYPDIEEIGKSEFFNTCFELIIDGDYYSRMMRRIHKIKTGKNNHEIRNLYARKS